jgi:YD repeat-containing protein
MSTRYSYYKAGYLVSKVYSDGKAVTYTYDKLSRVKTMSDWTGDRKETFKRCGVDLYL